MILNEDIKQAGRDLRRAARQHNWREAVALRDEVNHLRRATWKKPETASPCIRDRRFHIGSLSPARRCLLQANTGHRMKEDKFIDTQAARQKLKNQTVSIVARLLDIYRRTSGKWGADLRRAIEMYLVCLVTKRHRKLPAFAHQVFLPIMAHDARRELIKQFQLWINSHKHTRYYVVTSGTRCRVGDLAARFKWLHERVSEFRRWLKNHPEYHGIEVVLRCDEWTHKRESDGFLSFHPHTNLAIEFPFVLGGTNSSPAVRAAAYLKFKTAVDKFFGVMVQDCGEIRDPAELIKYIVKFEKDGAADGSLGLLDVTDEELAEIYAVRRGLKPVQALGSFQQYRRTLKEENKQIHSKWIDDLGQFKLVEVQMPRPDKKPKKERREELNGPIKEGDDFNTLVAITNPAPCFDVVSRPHVIVKNYNFDHDGLVRACGLEPLREFIEQLCHMRALKDAQARPSSYWVHTLTETREQDFDENPPDSVYDDIAPPEMVVQEPNHHL